MGYYYGIGGEFYLIAFVFAAISMIVSQRLKSKFKTYSKIQLRNGLSGAEIAEKMLPRKTDCQDGIKTWND